MIRLYFMNKIIHNVSQVFFIIILQLLFYTCHIVIHCMIFIIHIYYYIISLFIIILNININNDLYNKKFIIVLKYYVSFGS